MLNFVKFKGDDGDIGAFLEEYSNNLSSNSLLMLGALLYGSDQGPVVDDFEFTFTQLSQANKAEPFDGASIKLKFDLDDLNPEALADLQELLGDGNFQGMLVELGNGDAYLKIGYRNLPFADDGEDPRPEGQGDQPLTDLSYDLFG